MNLVTYDNELGVDISEGDDISDETIAAWRDAGVTHVYIQYSAKLPDYLRRLNGLGFVLDVYVYLYFPLSPWGQHPEDRVQTTLVMCNGYPIRRVWLDVEAPSDSDTPENTIAALWRCVALIVGRNLQPGIYTGKDTWNAHTGSSEAFADIPLWHADYLGEGSVPNMQDRPATLYFRHGPYGGWDKPDVWQWWNTSTFGGHSVDMNVEDPKEIDMKFILPRAGVASWWHGQTIEPNKDTDPEPFYVMDAVTDLGAQPGDVVRFQVSLIYGAMVFSHGETRLVAGSCAGGLTVVEAQVSDAGKIRFTVGLLTTVADVYALGYWR